jgi:nucleotidyltransferase/DNA polymerase involved in DNA repair
MDVSRTWVHIDMDMFYAAIEIRDRPDLEDKPVAVGD